MDHPWWLYIWKYAHCLFEWLFSKSKYKVVLWWGGTFESTPSDVASTPLHSSKASILYTLTLLTTPQVQNLTCDRKTRKGGRDCIDWENISVCEREKKWFCSNHLSLSLRIRTLDRVHQEAGCWYKSKLLDNIPKSDESSPCILSIVSVCATDIYCTASLKFTFTK